MTTEENPRSERLLVLLLLQQMKGTTAKEKARALNLAGFANSEIAELLETSPQVVANYLYELRSQRKGKKSATAS